jgi:hypothetical protein
VLLLRPALARLGDGVRLPHLLAAVVPCCGGVGLRRRRAGGDHEGNRAPGGSLSLSTCGGGRLALWWRPRSWLAVNGRVVLWRGRGRGRRVGGGVCVWVVTPRREPCWRDTDGVSPLPFCRLGAT